jgi:hypothetical protein
MSTCGVFQGLYIRMKSARTLKRKTVLRAELRRHVEGCSYCQRMMEAKHERKGKI